MRSAPYKARQGYVDTLRHVKLRRTDTHRTYEPSEEAYQIPEMSWDLEGDRHTISTLGLLNIRLVKSDELTAFLAGLTDPAKLHVEVECYHLFFPKEKYWLWSGVLSELPSGESQYPVDKLELRFVAPPGQWGDADNLKDPVTATWYKNAHVTDVLFPALLSEAFKVVPGLANLEEPRVYSSTPFWTGIDRPKKYLANSGKPFDETCRVSALCWDSHESVLYLGVHDAVGSATLPWIVSYNPATREWRKVTEFRYTGDKPFLVAPTEWEVCYLEYDLATLTLYYVLRTNHANLLDPQAHYHWRGSALVAAIPSQTTMGDANLFTLHDRGFRVRSKAVLYDNRSEDGTPPSEAGVDYYGDMETQQLGWGTPRHEVKECGAMSPGSEGNLGRIRCNLAVMPTYGQNKIYLTKLVFKAALQYGGVCIHDYVELAETNSHYRQWCGHVLSVIEYGEVYEITIEVPFGFHYTAVTVPTPHVHAIFYKETAVPSENIFVPEPQTVSVRFLFPDDLGSPDAQIVTVEHRKKASGYTNYYWPDVIGEFSEDGPFKIDVIGYVTFTAARDLDVADADSPSTYIKYRAGEPAAFEVTFAGYRPSYSLIDGLYVASALQGSSSIRPGPCRLMYNGAEVKTSYGKTLATYGNIFIWREDGITYVVWNDHAQDSKGTWYSQYYRGRWDGSQVVVVGVDRSGDNWRTTPERYVTAYARKGTFNYFGVRYAERIYVNTSMRVFWAAPPQATTAPRKYDCGYACTGAVKGDKTDILKNGVIVRLGPYGSPGLKEYLVVDVDTGERFIAPTMPWGNQYLADGETAGNYTMTWFTLLALDAFKPGDTAYNDQVGAEVRGQYISLACGRDERAQILQGTNLIYTAAPYYGEPVEGAEVDYDQQEWKGESITVAMDESYDRMPRVQLSGANIVAGSVIVTIKGSRKTLELTDYTNTTEATWFQTWPTPASYACYLHRRQGDEYNEAWLYFNPALLGQELNVTYNEYAAAKIQTFVDTPEGKIAVNEAGRHRFLIIDGNTVTSDYSPRFGDTALDVACLAETEIYGITSPSYLLVKRSHYASGYITGPIIGTDNPLWQVAGALARAGDQYLFSHGFNVVLRNRESYVEMVDLRSELEAASRSVGPFKRVVYSYANGSVAYGEGKPVLSLSSPYVTDKGLADALCYSAWLYYYEERKEYVIRCNGILDDEALLALKSFTFEGETVRGFVKSIKFTPDNKTEFVIVGVKTPRGEAD